MMGLCVLLHDSAVSQVDELQATHDECLVWYRNGLCSNTRETTA